MTLVGEKELLGWLWKIELELRNFYLNFSYYQLDSDSAGDSNRADQNSRLVVYFARAKSANSHPFLLSPSGHRLRRQYFFH